jgi:hypothetical protein
MAGQAGFANTLAVTEFLSDGYGSDTGLEYIEVFNYGQSPVDTTGWSISDDGNSFQMADETIASGDYRLYARDKSNLQDRWSITNPDLTSRIHDVSFALNNAGTEEIVVEDDEGNIQWNLSYQASYPPYRGTFLTDTDFSISDYGRDEDGQREVIFGGQDGTGTLGYESNDNTTDPQAVISSATSGPEVGSPLQICGGTPLEGYYQAVPEPTSAVLLGLGALAFAGRRRSSAQ